MALIIWELYKTYFIHPFLFLFKLEYKIRLIKKYKYPAGFDTGITSNTEIKNNYLRTIQYSNQILFSTMCMELLKFRSQTGIRMLDIPIRFYFYFVI